MYLYLCSVASSNIRDGPTGFFLNGLLRTTEQVKETLQGGAVQDHLLRQHTAISNLEQYQPKLSSILEMDLKLRILF